MDDAKHNEGDMYNYVCERCGFDRGVLHHPFLATICPDCNRNYKVTKIKIWGKRMIKEIEVVLNGEPIAEIDFIPRVGEKIRIIAVDKEVYKDLRYIVDEIEYTAQAASSNASVAVNVEELGGD